MGEWSVLLEGYIDIMDKGGVNVFQIVAF